MNKRTMANEFERAMVICINRYFTEHRMKGFACRLKQAHFNTRLGRKPASPVRACSSPERLKNSAHEP